MTTTHETKRYLAPSETAKMIRTDLKAAFPGVKFSVRTHNYSGGSSIYIGWTDGPTAAEVDAVSASYAGKGFDGMIDMSYYIDGWMLDGKIIGTRCAGTLGSMGTVSPWGMIAPHDDAELVGLGGSYVSTTRKISAAYAKQLATIVAEFWGGIDTIPEITQDGESYTMGQDGHRAIRSDVRWSWYDSIHQAASDPSKFVREAR